MSKIEALDRALGATWLVISLSWLTIGLLTLTGHLEPQQLGAFECLVIGVLCMTIAVVR